MVKSEGIYSDSKILHHLIDLIALHPDKTIRFIPNQADCYLLHIDGVPTYGAPSIRQVITKAYLGEVNGRTHSSD